MSGSYQGICRYCGQVDEQSQIAANQEKANQRISENCECGGQKRNVSTII